MVLFLTDNFVSQIKLTNDNAISALELLAIGRKYGRIVLTSTRESLKYLSDCESINEPTRAVFIYLYSNFPTNAIILKKVTFYVEITEKSNEMRIRINGSTTILELSYDYIHDIDIVNGTVVLAENQSEIDFYKVICECFKLNHDLEFLPVFYHPHMGGGHTTARAYNSFQEDRKKFCLCLADCDRKYPRASIGDTLKALLKIDDPTNFLCQIIGLEAREVENLIPLYFLEQACGNDVNYINGYNSISQIVSNSNPDVLLFLDIKEGLSTRKYVALTDTNFKKFIDSALIDSGLYSEAFLRELKINIDKNTVIDTLINGLGCNILERSLSKIDEYRDIKGLHNLLLTSQLEEWERIGEKFTNWTCCSPRLT